MRKLKLRWEISIEQDLDGLTNIDSPFYDKELTDEIIEKHGSIDNYKESEEFEEIKNIIINTNARYD